MEPSFWSWEKRSPRPRHTYTRIGGRNGAQLLELGKAQAVALDSITVAHVAMEPRFWSWEKPMSRAALILSL